MEDTKEVFANFKETVRRTADIVSIVSAYVPLKKKGGRYWGCCPFHGEKTPSFTVDESKGLFHCFGCGVGGDVFSFVMKQENLSFVESLKFLANKYNIPIPEREKTAAEVAREQAAKEIYTANAWAAKFFHSCLVNTQYGKAGLSYLAQRGITHEIIEKFGLGLAPASFNKMHQGLLSKGVSEKTMLEAGLVSKRETGGVYDKFRGRIMIPIKNPKGQVVGFTGRVLKAESSPAKYMNTAETAWFHKGKLLFGLDAALSAIRRHKQALVVEGHMDAISLHAAGIDWAVASMGTAFTEEQGELLKRLTTEVVFCFDSDQAGRNAAMRALPIAQKLGLQSRVIHVPEGKDPDDYVRKKGAAAFLTLLTNAVSGIDYELDTVLAKHDLNQLTGKVDAVTEILPYIAQIKSEIERSERLRTLARTLAIDEGLIQNEYKKIVRTLRKDEPPGPRILPRKEIFSASAEAQRVLLYSLFQTGELALEQDLTSAEVFYEPVYLVLYQKYQALKAAGACEAKDLFPTLSEKEAGALSSILEMDIPRANLALMVQDCFKQMQLERLQRQFQEHSHQASSYEKVDNEKFKQELAECQRIRKVIAELTASAAQKDQGQEGTS